MVSSFSFCLNSFGIWLNFCSCLASSLVWHLMVPAATGLYSCTEKNTCLMNAHNIPCRKHCHSWHCGLFWLESWLLRRGYWGEWSVTCASIRWQQQVLRRCRRKILGESYYLCLLVEGENSTSCNIGLLMWFARLRFRSCDAFGAVRVAIASCSDFNTLMEGRGHKV